MTPLKNRYDGVIIGAGISGLVCANYLAKAGKSILVVERRERPGGYCTSFEREGFNFDICRHLGGLSPEGIMRIMFSDLGIYERLNIKRSNPSDIIIIGDKQVCIFNDLSETKKSFKDAFPDEAKNIDSFFDFLSNLNAFDIVSKYTRYTFKDILDRFFKNEELKNTFCPLLGNAGLGPSQLSAVKGLLLYNQFILDGGYYLKEGNGGFSEALAEGLKEKGGDVLFNTSVKTIKLNKKRAEGVILDNDESVASNYVISGCDATETFLNLVGEPNLPSGFVKRLKGMLASMSVFMVFLGIKEELITKGLLKDKTTIWYNPAKYSADDNFDTIYKGIYEARIDMQHGHVVITPSFAGAGNNSASGKIALTLYVGVPYMSSQFWDENRDSFCENVINRAERFLPGLSGSILVKETATPHTFYKYTLNKNGAMYGWASTPKQIFPSAMPPVTPISRLFLCGHWTTTGFGQGGIMSVAYTGMRLAEEIVKRS